MGKPKMIGYIKPFVRNSNADPRRKTIKRRKRK